MSENAQRSKRNKGLSRGEPRQRSADPERHHDQLVADRAPDGEQRKRAAGKRLAPLRRFRHRGRLSDVGADERPCQHCRRGPHRVVPPEHRRHSRVPRSLDDAGGNADDEGDGYRRYRRDGDAKLHTFSIEGIQQLSVMVATSSVCGWLPYANVITGRMLHRRGPAQATHDLMPDDARDDQQLEPGVWFRGSADQIARPPLRADDVIGSVSCHARFSLRWMDAQCSDRPG